MNSINFKIVDILNDEKVKAMSVFGVMTTCDYLSLVKNNLLNDKLLFQRGKETRKREIYKRLKEDLKKDTVIPTISLALYNKTNSKIAIGGKIKIKEGDVYVLDGLQRTFALIEAKNELTSTKIHQKSFLRKRLRFEIWINASIEALLYKMIVLNSGQTPMSIRHQIEILNKAFKEDFIKKSERKVEIYTWKDKSKRRKKPLQYLLSDLVEIFLSFAMGKTSVEKKNLIVDQIEKINFLDEYTGIKERYGENDILFVEFVNLITRIDILLCKKYSGNKELTSGNYLMKSNTFLSGFCAAFGKALSVNKTLYKNKKNELLNLLKSTKRDPLYLELLSTIIINLRSTSKRFGDTERQFYFDAFIMFINNKDGDKSFKTFWSESIPELV